MKDSVRRSQRLTTLAIAVLFLGWILLSPIRANAQGFTLVTPVTLPGSGGGNPAYLTPVLRFQFMGSGLLNPLASILGSPATLVTDPSFAAFNSRGELFVANRHGNILGGVGSIARFTFDAAGNFIPNGSITGNSLEAVHGLAFSQRGELFAANYVNGTISRFLFDAQGNAFANGTIITGLLNMGLAFNRSGELFATHSSNIVSRFLFDPATRAAMATGYFVVPGSLGLHGLAFGHTGELFVGDIYTSLVFRFRFDSAGNPIPNGTIVVPGGPIGVAFSRVGEFFATSHFTGGISRFIFDANGNAISNGFISTPQLGGAAIAP